jgi:arylsulfatase A-like enzyme
MPETPSRPNVLFIMADQHRFDFLGAAGADFLRTPNLDRIANEGVRFTQCTTNCPVCAPARIALASGLQPSRLGSLDNYSYLPASVTTYYQRLRDHGYRVGGVGKFDLAKPDGYNGLHGDRPCNYTFGFTHPVECEGKMHAGKKSYPRGPYGFWLQEQGLFERFHRDYAERESHGWVRDASHDSVLPTEAFEDLYIGRRAVEWVEHTTDDFPWHLFVSFVGPHDPFDPPTQYAARYRDVAMPPAISFEPEGKPRRYAQRNVGLEPAQVEHTRRQYCAAIEAIDDAIGQVLDAIERRGMSDNTFIVFASDHGEMLGDHGQYTKTVPYEASLRVPLLVAGPGIAGGRTSDALVELIDVNPTICELMGLPPQEGIDADSFAGILNGRCTEHRAETVSGIRQWRCIRTERYKLVDNYNDIRELYDLVEDPDEGHNLAQEERELAGELAARMNERFAQGAWRH